jgi:hypothetical protein
MIRIAITAEAFEANRGNLAARQCCRRREDISNVILRPANRGVAHDVGRTGQG